jgi:probable phosphoglycerate mutase
VERAILSRHAESAFSAKDLLNGDPYVWNPLTRAGRKQAARLGELVRDEPIDLCVTTRFARTRETADIALEGRPVPRLVLPELDDVKVGEFEGKPVEDYREWQQAHSPTDAPDGGEGRVEAIRRYVAAYRTILAREEPVILVVAHGLPITAVLLGIRGQDIPPTLQGIQVEPAEPHPVTAEDLTMAIRNLRAWVRKAEGS